MAKTKIIATIGPASSSKEILKKMIESGMDVVRINFSHGTHEANGQLINSVKELNAEIKTSIGIMADFQGPRIRVGNEAVFSIEKGEIILISSKKSSSGKELIIDHSEVVKSLVKGDRILIEDGLMELKITEKSETIKAEVINGGEIKPRKGINVPDTQLAFGALTEKDEKDLQYALSQSVDFVAFSFVSNGQEIEDIREKIKKTSGKIPQIVSKIERKEAIKNIDEIIAASDVIMVARGDLGIELPESQVVLFQKEIIGKCIKAKKLVIVATQMLNSMIENPIPTRAEVSDVSNAVIDHTDYVMLSGESANGKYPVEAVAMMNKIIEDTEASPFDDNPPAFLDSVEYKG